MEPTTYENLGYDEGTDTDPVKPLPSTTDEIHPKESNQEEW